RRIRSRPVASVRLPFSRENQLAPAGGPPPSRREGPRPPYDLRHRSVRRSQKETPPLEGHLARALPSDPRSKRRVRAWCFAPPLLLQPFLHLLLARAPSRVPR